MKDSHVTKNRILGLDPGLRHTGWGVIDILDNRLSHVAHGVIDSTQKQPLAIRLNEIYNGIKEVILKYAPTEAAVEETFVNKNPVSTLKLGEARGVVLLAPASFDLPVAEYAANRIKKSVVGAGHADKNQMITMIRHIMPSCGSLTADAADALAVAVCHTHYRLTQSYWQKGEISL